MAIRPIRSLTNAPGFSLLVVFILALGIGTTTALFSVVDAVLLQPLAFHDADRVVAIRTAWPAKGRTTARITGGDFIDLRASLRSIQPIAVYNGGEIGLQLRDHARFAWTYFSDPNFFRVLDVKPLIGRLPDLNDHTQTAVVKASFAEANWNDARKALGEFVTVDNKAYQIAAVIDDRFAFPEKAEVWITASMNPESRSHSAFNYYAVGRLRRAATLKKAQSELSAVIPHLANDEVGANDGKTFQVVPLREALTGPSRTTLLFLFGAAGLLLLISCANIANLMLARALARGREIAVRVSLGANTASIVRMLMAEGVALGCAAAAIGIAIAYASLRAITPLIPETVPRTAAGIPMHASALLFAASLAFLTVILCSLVPVLHLRTANLAEVLKQAPGRGFVGGGSRSRQLIVVAQIALCCVLSVGAALLSRTFLALIHAPLGYHTEGVLVMYADAPAFELPQYLKAIQTFETGLDDIRHIPGVRSAAAIMGLPSGRYGSDGGYLVEGVHIQPGQDPFKMNWPANVPEAIFSVASPDYFKTVGIPLLAGRDFTLRDQYTAPFTAIISQSLARQSFGSSNPIGRRIYCGLDSPQPMTIVGVVGDVRQDSPASKPDPEIYMPFQQHPYHANELEIAVRTDGDPKQLIAEVRTRMHRLAPFMATEFTTFSDMVHDSIAAPRFRATLALIFAILALTLGMTGIYSVMAYHVAQRTPELALRIALGADKTSIMALVFGRALTLALSGLAIGVACAVAISRLITALLYGIRAVDLPAYTIGAAAVLIITVGASWIPTWRASRLDPAVTLRSN